MTKVIGISLGYNTSAVLINEYGVQLAISEERLNGEKNTKKFPILALRECMKKLDPKPHETVYVGISSYEVINDRTLRYMEPTHRVSRENYGDFYSYLKEYIREEAGYPLINVDIMRVEHHEAHRLPAFYMSGLDYYAETPITVTYDGFGDGICATIFNNRTGELLARENIDVSLGLVYQFVTGALGFKEHQHEGKITGLAALGKPIWVEEFKQNFIDYDPIMMTFIPKYKDSYEYVNASSGIYDLNKNIKGFRDLLQLKWVVYNGIHLLKEQNGAKDADIAASVQEYTEQLVTQWVKDVLAYNGIEEFSISLSGGLFANVKVNYRMKKETGAKRLFVLPPMGDEGTAIGAALKMLIHQVGASKIDYTFCVDDLYLGKTKEGNIQKADAFAIDHVKYKVFPISDLDDAWVTTLIPDLLAKRKIVCMSRGFSEFGPRALGNHSILFDASEKETNDSLNKRLSRTEFMPFAPITLDVYADELFYDIEGLGKTLKYMTIAVPVKPDFVEGYKAAYHVDNTARPQVLSKSSNSILYRIIREYSFNTGKKALINTSFNLHNHPIIFDDYTAYQSFVHADLDCLVLDDKIIVKRDLV